MPAPRRNGIRSHFEVEASHDNTSQEIIRTTSDKLKLVLIDHLEKVENAKSWQAPFGLIITIITVFCTADFREAFKVPGDTWRAFFLFSLFGSTVWLISSLIKYRKSPSIESIVNKIKNAEE